MLKMFRKLKLIKAGIAYSKKYRLSRVSVLLTHPTVTNIALRALPPEEYLLRVNSTVLLLEMFRNNSMLDPRVHHALETVQHRFTASPTKKEVEAILEIIGLEVTDKELLPPDTDISTTVYH